MNRPPVPQPERRPLRVFAFDPMASQAPSALLGSATENEVVLEVDYEPLKPGPIGRRVAVLDYDASHRCYYPPIDLDDPAMAMAGGLAPNEADPRFHQQMVYAVVMKTLENFDRALGRRVRLANRRGRPFQGLGERLGVVPHAFEQTNAYFEPVANSLLFGYFTAEAAPGSAFVGGQTVFTCLSSDVVAHETTHALVHRLRPRFMEPTNLDVGAFHEGFSDIVAIFQHFTYPGLLRKVISRTGGVLDQPGLFVDLAQQFGYGSGGGAALRTAIASADPQALAKTHEPHDRGAILVAAVFDAFFAAYRQRVDDLVGVARDAGAALPQGVVNRVARDAETTAQEFLTMCIRAFEYLPPVDITFGDFLRAAITADIEVNAGATRRNRELLIDAFRRRGIYPEGVFSLSESSLRWDPVDDDLPPLPTDAVGELLLQAREIERGSSVRITQRKYAQELSAYATKNAEKLGLLRPKGKMIQTTGFHPSFQVGTDGQLHVDVVLRFEQVESTDNTVELPMSGGSTVIAAADGTVRYVIAKPLPGVERQELSAAAVLRRARTRAFVERCDKSDPVVPWMSDAEFAARAGARLSFASLHAARVGGRV